MGNLLGALSPSCCSPIQSQLCSEIALKLTSETIRRLSAAGHPSSHLDWRGNKRSGRSNRLRVRVFSSPQPCAVPHWTQNQELNRNTQVRQVCWPVGQGHLATSAWPHTPCCRVSHILNMAREIDNFYPERFTYHNVRLWDEESAQLLPHWKETHSFVEAARSGCPHPNCLPHPRVKSSHALLLAALALRILPSFPGLEMSLLPALPSHFRGPHREGAGKGG